VVVENGGTYCVLLGDLTEDHMERAGRCGPPTSRKLQGERLDIVERDHGNRSGGQRAVMPPSTTNSEPVE